MCRKNGDERVNTQSLFRGLILACLMALISAAGASAQTAPSAEVDPIQCWWRTDGVARVGEVFHVVLTCSALESKDVTAVPDESTLDPGGIQMTPFEVVSGNRSTDLRSGDRRMFQYVYNLRLINPDFFGRDLKLPETKITYRMQRRSGNNSTVEGIENSYSLPALPMRVLSLVPSDAQDIREAPIPSFRDIESRSLIGTILTAIAGALFLISLFFVVNAVMRWVRARNLSGVVREAVPNLAVLRKVMNELSTIEHDRQISGFSTELNARLLTVLRVAAAYAIKGNVVKLPAASVGVGQTGYLPVHYRRHRFAEKVSVMIPAAITSQSFASAIGHKDQSLVLDDLERSISRLSGAEYSTSPPQDSTAFDLSLQAGVQAVRALYKKELGPAWKMCALKQVLASME